MSFHVTLSRLGAETPLFDNVHAYTWHERLHALSTLTVEVRHPNSALDTSSLIGEALIAHFADEPFQPIVVALVATVRQLTSEPTGLSRYEIVLVPPHWLATCRTDHRIFQDCSAADVAAKVFGGDSDGAPQNALGYNGRAPVPDVRSLVETHEVRPYTVQYGETDWDFVLRVLAEDGVTAAFGPSGVLTLLDDTTIGDLAATVPFVPPAGDGAQPAHPHVSELVIMDGITPGVAFLRDYDFTRPDLVLERSARGKAETPVEADIETYSFAVGVWTAADDAVGDFAARHRLELARASRRTITCRTSFRLSAGTRFALTDHPRADVDGPLLVVAARAVARERNGAPVVEHELECIPGATPYRPPLRPKPRIKGVHTAIVVGPDTEEIDIDQYGRVEVEFRWDRRDRHTGGTSRRVRVAQAWSNAGYGFVLHPRKNEEVVVIYEDGDPDEPLIVGRLYNGWNVPAANLPAERTKSMWRSRSSPGGQGYNLIMMEDRAGEEVLEIRAQRDLVLNVLRNTTTNVALNSDVVVKGDHSVSVEGDQYTVVKETDWHHAKNVYTGADKLLMMTADDAQIHAVTKVDIQGSKIRLSGGTIEVEGDNAITLKVGGSQIKITPGEISITSPSVNVKADGEVSIKGALVKINC